MATTPEGKVKKAVRNYLKTIGAYYFFPVQTGYGMSSLDILGCYRGFFFAIETKAPGKTMTPRQELVAQLMVHAGARVFLIDGEDKMEGFKEWVSSIRELTEPYWSQRTQNSLPSYHNVLAPPNSNTVE